jgi:hypothetical protein
MFITRSMYNGMPLLPTLASKRLVCKSVIENAEGGGRIILKRILG